MAVVPSVNLRPLPSPLSLSFVPLFICLFIIIIFYFLSPWEKKSGRGNAIRVHFSQAAVGIERFHSLWRLKLSATRRWPASILWGNCICLASRAAFCISSFQLICYGRGSVSTPRTPTDTPRTTGKYLFIQQCQLQLPKSKTCLLFCSILREFTFRTNLFNREWNGCSFFSFLVFFLVFTRVYGDFIIPPWSRFVLHLLTNPLTCTWAVRSYIADAK